MWILTKKKRRDVSTCNLIKGANLNTLIEIMEDKPIILPPGLTKEEKRKFIITNKGEDE